MNSREIQETAHRATQAREQGLFAVLGGALVPGMIILRGPGSAEFLQGQVSNDVSGLLPGRGNAAARLTRAGALTHMFTQHRLPDAGNTECFALILEHGAAGTLVADLERYLFTDDITLTDTGAEYRWLLIQGPRVSETLTRVFGETLPLPAEYAVSIPQEGVLPAGSLIFGRGLSAERGTLMALPAASGHEFVELLRIAAVEEGLLAPEGAELAELLEMLRVESGWPRLGVDMEPGRQSLPETGLEEVFVDYEKGCYLGQEVIARMRSYGSPAHALRGLILCDAKDEDAWPDALANLPDPGSPLIDAEGLKVGRLASRTVSPMLGQPVVLVFLDRKHRTPGAKMRFQGKRQDFTATVALPPFHRPQTMDDDAAGLYDGAMTLFADRRDEAAIDLLERAIVLEPEFAAAYEALGVILGRSERYDEAIGLFERLEAIAPDEPMVNTNLSLYSMKIGDKQRAEDEMAKATVKKFRALSGGGEDRRGREEAESQRLEVERRLDMFREVLEIDPDDALALGGLGKGLADLGRWDEAEDYLRRACEGEKDNAPLFELLGRVLEALQRGEEAQQVYERGIEAASRKGSLMPLKKMEQRLLLLRARDQARS